LLLEMIASPGYAGGMTNQRLLLRGDRTMHTLRWLGVTTVILLLTSNGNAQNVLKITSFDKTREAVANDRQIRIIDTATMKDILSMIGHTQPITTMAFTPDGKQLITGSLDRSVRIWDLTTGRVMRSMFLGAPVLAVAVSLDGKDLATIDNTQESRVYELATGRIKVR
jgi:WD40 repeat protein